MPKKLFATTGFTHLDASCVPVRTPSAERLPTGTLEASALACIDGTRTIAQIASELRLSDVEGSSLVRRLVDIGAVTIGASPPGESDADGRPTIPSEGAISRSASGKRRRVR